MHFSFKKNGAGFALALLLLAAVGVVSFRSTQRMSREAEWVNHTHEVMATIERLLEIVGHDGVSYRGYLITRDEAFVRGQPQALADTEAALEKLKGLIADNPQQQERFAVIAPLIVDRLNLVRKFAEVAKTESIEALRSRVHGGERKLDVIYALGAEMIADERALLNGREMRSKASARTTQEVIVLGSVLAFTLVGGALGLLARELDSRRKGETALRQSEARCRSIFDDAAVPTGVSLPPDGRYVQVNRALCELLGYSEEELLAMTIEAVTHPEDRAGLTREPLRNLINGEIVTFRAEKRYLRKDGAVVWADTSVSLVRDAEQQPLYFIAQIQDITGRKRTEAALKENRDVLELAIKVGNFGIWDWDLVTGKTMWSERRKEMSGLPRDAEMSDAVAFGTVHPDDLARVQAGFALALESKLDSEAEYRTVWPDGTVRWVQVRGRAIYDATGKPVRVTGITHDITGRRQAEEALLKSQELLELAVEAGRIGIWNWDLTTDKMVWSERCNLIFGLPRDTEASFAVSLTAVHPDDRAAAEASVKLGLETKVNTELEYRTVWPDGTVRWVHSRGRVFDDAAGKPVRFTGIMLDVTERRESEEALRQSEEFSRSIIKSSPDCIKVLDLKGTLLSMLSGQELLGIEDIQPFLNQSWLDFWKGEADRRAAQAAVESAAAGGTGNFVGFFRTLRGEAKWWDVSISPILNADGKPSRLLTVSRDVTGRQQAEEVLRQRTAQFETLVNEAPLGVVLIDADFRIRQMNPIARPVYGDIPDLIGRDYAEVLHIVWPAAQADEAIKQFRHTLETGEPCFVPEMIEKRADRQTTEYYEWQINRIPLPDGRPGVVCYFRDISERVLAQQEIRESEERYRSLFNSMDEGFCIIEMIFDESQQPVDWRYLEVNPSFETLTGIHDIVGKRIRDLVPDHEGYWFEIYGKVVLTGEPVRFVNEAKGLDRWFDLYAFRVGGAGSLKVAVLFTNITERKRAEAEILSLNQELESRVAERTAELRTVVYTLEAEMAERRRLEEEILGVGERAQARIGQDLHDDLGQQLAGLAMLAQLLSDQLSAESHPKAADAARLKTFLTESISTTRNLAKSLYPVELERGGLMLALHDLAHRTELRAGMVCTVRADDAFRFEKAAEIHLYRIVQESIGNALKHGNARHIAIGCTAREGASTLTVTDDGSGFERPKEGKWAGMGLHLFQYRARLIGAAVTVARGEHGGCQVSCSMGISKATQTRALRGDSTHASLPS